MSRCTAPRQGHRSAAARANCPSCGGRGYGYSAPSYYTPQPSYSRSSSGGGSGSSAGSGVKRTRPRWSPSTSTVSYTPAEVQALTPARRAVEARAGRPELRDVFLCHAWDDRRGVAAELNDLIEAAGASVWFSEKDIVLGQPFLREIDKGLAKSRTGIVLVTPALLKRIDGGGVSDKELSALLARDMLIPVVHGTTYEELRDVSPLLGSRNGLDTTVDSLEVVAAKIVELVTVEDELVTV